MSFGHKRRSQVYNDHYQTLRPMNVDHQVINDGVQLISVSDFWQINEFRFRSLKRSINLAIASGNFDHRKRFS